LRPEDAADEEAVARLFAALGGDAADIRAAARRLKGENEAGKRIDHVMAEMRWLAERFWLAERRFEQAEADTLDVSLDGKLIDDICEMWTKILGRKVGKGGGNVDGPLMRFAEACFVLLGEPQTTRNAIRQAVRRRDRGSTT
jgi:hypothetical protein